MPIFDILRITFWTLAPLTLILIGLGAFRHPRWYWAAAFTSYICSYIGFSIGIFLVSLTFSLVVLALGHSFKLIRSYWHSVVAFALGVGLWGLALTTAPGYIFYPFRLLSPWLSNGTSGGGYGSCVEVNDLGECIRY